MYTEHRTWVSNACPAEYESLFFDTTLTDTKEFTKWSMGGGVVERSLE